MLRARHEQAMVGVLCEKPGTMQSTLMETWLLWDSSPPPTETLPKSMLFTAHAVWAGMQACCFGSSPGLTGAGASSALYNVAFSGIKKKKDSFENQCFSLYHHGHSLPLPSH